MAEIGYIKLHRKLLNWEWYDDTNVKILFIHCLLKANWEDSVWKGTLIKKGSFPTGRQKLAQELNLTEMQVRTALKKLKSTNEITIKTTSEYSIITVNNWDSYQQNNQQDIQQITSKITTLKEYKNIRNKEYNYNSLIKDNNDKSYSSDFLQKSHSESSVKKNVFKKPTIEEIKQYCIENNKNVDAESFYNFYESKNWMIGKNKMQKWKAAIATWDRKNKLSKSSEPHESIYSNELGE